MAAHGRRRGTCRAAVRAAGYVVLLLTLLATSLPSFPARPVQAQPGFTPAIAPLNPEFQKWVGNQARGLSTAGGYVPPPFDLSVIDRLTPRSSPASRTLPGVWDWRTQGKVTPVKDQGACGTCWAFGSAATLESRVLVVDNVTYDFSEQNLVTCTDPAYTYLVGNRCNAGGNALITADTLSKKGARLESDQPYDTGIINTQACGDGGTTVLRITDWSAVGGSVVTSDQINAVKNFIYAQGPVHAAYCQESGHLYEGNIYYWPGTTTPANHMITIVGWNDTIAHPLGGGSGAWIVKNSWGTDWGNAGYFYLCYGSAKLGGVGGYGSYAPYNPNERIYSWDEAGMVNAIGAGSDYAYAANIFTASVSGTVGQVGVWTTAPGASVEVMLTKGALADIRWRANSGYLPSFGYHTISVGSDFTVNAGEQFIVAVRFQTPGNIYPVPIEMVQTGYCSPTIQQGKSYIGVDRDNFYVSWTDAWTYGWNVPIRAIVAAAPPAPALSGSAVSASQINLTWSDGSTIETGFSLERKAGTAGTYNEIVRLPANTTNYTDTTVIGDYSYAYRIRAFDNWAYSAYSNELPITTPTGVLRVSTGDPTDVGDRGAKLAGNLDSFGSDYDVRVAFQFGVTPGDYTGEIGEGSKLAHTATSHLRWYAYGLGYVAPDNTTYYRNLLPGTTYYYRARAVGLRTGAVAYGAEKSFTTDPPKVATLAASDITQNSARLNANLVNLPPATTSNVSFEYGPTQSYGSVTPPQPRTAPGPVSANVTVPAPGTYHFRAKADSGAHGVSYGDDLTFTTALTWGAVKTPDSSGFVVASPSEGNSFAASSDGRVVFMSDIPNNRLLRSTDGGYSWADITAELSGSIPMPVYQVAVAPGDGNVVAVVTDYTGYGKRRMVRVSMNAAMPFTTWTSMSVPAWQFSATEEIADIAISPARPDYVQAAHDIFFVTRDTAGGAGKVYASHVQASTIYSFIRQDVDSTGNPPAPVQSYTSVRFSPSYVDDRAMVVVGATAAGTFLNIGRHDHFNMNTVWNTAAGYPVQLRTGSEPSANWSTLVTSDIALPSDFDARVDTKRRAYVCWDDAGRTSGAHADVYRTDNVTVSRLNLADRPYSIAHSGDYATGKLLASLVSTNASATASMSVFRSVNPQSGTPVWTAATKPPTGASAIDKDSQEARAQVSWSADGTKAFASSFTTGTMTTSTNWSANSGCWQAGKADDESAFSLSTDNGDTWNQLSYVDTIISGSNDLAVSRDGATAYLATYNLDVPIGSIWRSRSSPLGNRWERVACVRTSNPSVAGPVTLPGRGAPGQPLLSPFVRLAPEVTDGSVVFWGDFRGTRLQKSVDFGQTWSDTAPGFGAADFAAADQNTLYVIGQSDDVGMVRKGTASGTTWTWQPPQDTLLGGAHSIAALGNTVVVGASSNVTGEALPHPFNTGNGLVAFSLDGGATWDRTTTPLLSGGNMHVAIDPDFAVNRAIYVADDSAGGGVYRWRVGTSTVWERISSSAARRIGIVAAAPGTIYTARGTVNGGVDRTRSALNLLPAPGVAWDNLAANLPLPGSTNVTFESEPTALVYSGTAPRLSVWSLNSWFPNQVFALTDTASAAGPTVATNAAQDVTGTSASLKGNLTVVGTSTPVSVYFEYGTTPGFGRNTAPRIVPWTGWTGVFSDNLTGLVSNTLYYYRARADSASGSGFGGSANFTTPPVAPPVLTTDNATGVTVGSATLNGTLTDKGSADNVTVSFEWGLTTSYRGTTPPVSTNATGGFSAALASLAPTTTFHYRAKAVGDGTSYGGDVTFITRDATFVPESANVTRMLPAAVYRSQTFDVRVTFAATADNFTPSSLRDVAPEGWSVTTNPAWCTPPALDSLPVGRFFWYIWNAASANGTAFTAVYRVTVPADASPGSYQFVGGRIVYYVGGAGPFAYQFTDSQVQVLDGAGLVGATFDAKGTVLGGVTVTLDGGTSVVSDSFGCFQTPVSATGTYALVARKTGFRDQPQTVNVTLLAGACPADFKGDYGLVPDAASLSFVLACVNRWRIPPPDGTGLSLSKVLSVVNAWRFPN